MKDFLRQTIEVLKKRVHANLDIIHNNELMIRDILKEPVSSKRSEKLSIKYNANKKLLAENNESIKIQMSIIKFLDQFKENFKEDLSLVENSKKKTEKKNEQNNKSYEVSKEDFFELTTSGEVTFDKGHPYFNDQEFFDALLSHYTQEEDYEMCAALLKQKDTE
ncbi:MAG: hypothetical protein R6V16_05375 [Bacteroidales bacterium]